jgi:hypothetical protein
MSDRSWGERRRPSSGRGRAAQAEREALAIQIAARLRTPMQADPTFAARVMRAVREEARHGGEAQSLWRRRLVVHVTPLRALALAAGLAALVVGAELVTERARPATPREFAAAQRDTVHVVRFVLVAPGASTVAVVGDFNHWNLNAHPLAPANARGVWSTSVELPPGRHEYVFVIDGTRWVADPGATSRIADEFGGESSTITVGRSTPPRTS